MSAAVDLTSCRQQVIQPTAPAARSPVVPVVLTPVPQASQPPGWSCTAGGQTKSYSGLWMDGYRLPSRADRHYWPMDRKEMVLLPLDFVRRKLGIRENPHLEIPIAHCLACSLVFSCFFLLNTKIQVNTVFMNSKSRCCLYCFSIAQTKLVQTNVYWYRIYPRSVFLNLGVATPLGVA